MQCDCGLLTKGGWVCKVLGSLPVVGTFINTKVFWGPSFVAKKSGYRFGHVCLISGRAIRCAISERVCASGV